jgi:hypothetical protein
MEVEDTDAAAGSRFDSDHEPVTAVELLAPVAARRSSCDEFGSAAARPVLVAVAAAWRELQR